MRNRSVHTGSWGENGEKQHLDKNGSKAAPISVMTPLFKFLTSGGGLQKQTGFGKKGFKLIQPKVHVGLFGRFFRRRPGSR
jgi:hypothetical protein